MFLLIVICLLIILVIVFIIYKSNRCIKFKISENFLRNPNRNKSAKKQYVYEMDDGVLDNGVLAECDNTIKDINIIVDKEGVAHVDEKWDIVVERGKFDLPPEIKNMRKEDYVVVQEMDREREHEVFEERRVVLHEDSQNVHDSVLCHETGIKWKKLIAEAGKKDNSKTINLDILNRAHIEQREKLAYILSLIEKRNGTIMNMDGSSEVEVFNTVWNNSSELRKDQLINDILDCSNGKNAIHCPTGVVTRIMNSDIVDDIRNVPKTTEILHEEIMNTASKIYKECENIDNDNERKDVFRRKLLAKLEEDYKDIISSKDIEKEINSWIDAV